MAEIPFLKADYEKYGKKGFEIYAMSFDSQRDRWIDAVRQQGMKWIQVSDLSGFQTPAAEAYAVQSIPSNFLIRCSDGQIVATQLRGEALGENSASCSATDRNATTAGLRRPFHPNLYILP